MLVVRGPNVNGLAKRHSACRLIDGVKLARQNKREEFFGHYHKRSNVESTFSAIKRKFGDAVRSKDDTAMVNEVLCKILAHNLCCLIQEQAELGIETEFWPEEMPKGQPSQQTIDVAPLPSAEFDFAELAFV